MQTFAATSFLKTATISAFADEIQNISLSRRHALLDEGIEWMLKEAGFFGAIGTGLQRSAQAGGRAVQSIGRGISNQANQLNYHLGNAMSQADPHAIVNPTMPVPGVGAAVSGGVNFLTSKLPQKTQSLADIGVRAALPSHTPISAGTGQLVGHAISALAPGLGTIGHMAAKQGITRGAPILANKISPSAGKFVQQVLNVSR